MMNKPLSQPVCWHYSLGDWLAVVWHSSRATGHQPPHGEVQLVEKQKNHSIQFWFDMYITFHTALCYQKGECTCLKQWSLKNLKAIIRKLLFLQIITDGINFCLWVSIIIWCLCLMPHFQMILLFIPMDNLCQCLALDVLYNITYSKPAYDIPIKSTWFVLHLHPQLLSRYYGHLYQYGNLDKIQLFFLPTLIL